MPNWRIIVLGLVAAAALGLFLQYQSLRHDNRVLRENVDTFEELLAAQKSATAAALRSLQEYGLTLKEFQDDLQELSEQDADIVRRLGGIRDELRGARLERLVPEDPIRAGNLAGSAVNELGSLFNCATTGSPDCTDRAAITRPADTATPE